MGGLANYLKVGREESKKHPFWENILWGLCASSLIPLFLNTISSNLIAESASDKYKFFVFFGFCLLASLCAKAFIQSISDKLISDIKKTQEEVRNVKQEAEIVNSKVTEPSEAEAKKMKMFSFGVDSDSDFDSDTKKIVVALGGGEYAWRTPSGIAREAGMAKEKVLKILDSLVSKQIVVKMREKNRWGLNLEGRDAFSKISSDQK